MSLKFKKYALALLLPAIAVAMAFVNAESQSPMEIPSPNGPQYKISVKLNGSPLGDIKIRLFPDVAPKTCANFDSLVAVQFYDGILIHRVIPGFVLQMGDPNTKNKPRNTWGMGDPSLTKVPAEFSKLNHKRGILSMARRGNDINSGTSQFFICHGDALQLDGQYTVFGEVIEGLDTVDEIAKCKTEPGDKPVDTYMITITKIKK